MQEMTFTLWLYQLGLTVLNTIPVAVILYFAVHQAIVRAHQKVATIEREAEYERDRRTRRDTEPR